MKFMAGHFFNYRQKRKPNEQSERLTKTKRFINKMTKNRHSSENARCAQDAKICS